MKKFKKLHCYIFYDFINPAHIFKTIPKNLPDSYIVVQAISPFFLILSSPVPHSLDATDRQSLSLIGIG